MSETEKLLDLIRRLISLEGKDPLLKSEIHSHLNRLGIDLCMDLPDFDFAKKVEKLFHNSLLTRELDFDNYILKEKVWLHTIQKDSRRHYVTINDTSGSEQRILAALFNEKSYKYTYTFSNLGLENNNCLLKEVDLHKKRGDPKIFVRVFDVDGDGEVAYEREINEDTLYDPNAVESFIENLRRYPVRELIFQQSVQNSPPGRNIFDYSESISEEQDSPEEDD